MKDAEYQFAIERRDQAVKKAREARKNLNVQEESKQEKIAEFWARQAAAISKGKKVRVSLEILINISLFATVVFIFYLIRIAL